MHVIVSQVTLPYCYIIHLVDTPTVAPGWPNVHCSHGVSADSLMSCDHVTVSSDKGTTSGQASTDIGKILIMPIERA